MFSALVAQVAGARSILDMNISGPRKNSQESDYRLLDERKVVETLEVLKRRIEQRFPEASLAKVATELLKFAEEAAQVAVQLRQPNWALRAGAVLAGALILGIVWAGISWVFDVQQLSPSSDMVQTVNAVINNLVFLGAAVFFFFTVEGRIKRRKALATLHRLRSIVHIIDMHQLTKDPERLMLGAEDTESSPTRTLSVPELGRYLDYCSELLSISSKIAALFAQHLVDPVVLATVNEIETLAAGLSSKIWQKITLLSPQTQS